MMLGTYKRCEIAVVTTLALQGIMFGTTRMTPSEIARFNGWASKSVYRSLNMAKASGLVLRQTNGYVVLTHKAVEAIREAFRYGFDGKRRKAVGAR